MRSRSGNSIIVLGEAGTGKTELAVAVHEEMLGEYNSAIATYKGSIKKFFIAMSAARLAQSPCSLVVPQRMSEISLVVLVW